MVNKKIIEKLSDRELEDYIKPDSRFVSTAISYAYEILQSKGRTFDDSEKLRIENYLRERIAPKSLEYRARSFILPVIIALVIYTPLVYIIIMGM